jgi:hypothetical protein
MSNATHIISTPEQLAALSGPLADASIKKRPITSIRSTPKSSPHRRF